MSPRNLLRACTSQSIDDRCVLPGFIDDVPAFLDDLDMFVLSSHIEGHPMVLLEAMAMALPVVATAIPGVADMLDDGVDGRLVPVGDIPALAAAMDGLRRDQDSARRYGVNARRKIEREYAVDRMVQRTELLYTELLEDKGIEG